MKVKKRMEKKPVLTSPWKIGAFVSLLLVLVSLWVGCYLASCYNVDLKWLKTGATGWGIDSDLFFRQMYPLAAGVILVSLFSYFLIVSAVRRYKFYLDSGQDYRKMISLAESIDDLTNPAQIARLSSYPELQGVLRNYGDQIREISQDLGQGENAVDLDELESEISRLLRGACASDEAFAGKGYASICRKIRDHVEASRARFGELEKRNETDRRIIGQAALASGRAMEAMSGAGEDLLEIARSAHELEVIAGETREDVSSSANADAGTRNKALKVIVTDMESSVRKLEDGGHVLHEFSEENNGIAINLALMAARGSVDEHDLATFAERVRSTAERFHKLSGTVSSIAQGLLAACYAFKEKIGEKASSGAGARTESQRAIAEHVKVIEERSSAIQKQICSLGSELHEVHELLQDDFAAVPGSGAASEKAAQQEGSYRTENTEKAPELIIDHGAAWKGMAGREKAGHADRAEEPFSSKEMEESKVVGRVSRDTGSKTDTSDFSDMSSLRELDVPAGAEPEAAPQQNQAYPEQDSMETPAQRWRKIDIEKTEQEEETGTVAVTVETLSRTGVQSPAAEPRTPVDTDREDAAAAEAVAEAAAEVAARETSKARAISREQAEAETARAKEHEALPADEDENGEPIHDLFELGAVEYVEETETRR